MESLAGHGKVWDITVHWTADSALERIQQIYKRSLMILKKSFEEYIEHTNAGKDDTFYPPHHACYPYLGIKLGPNDLLSDAAALSFGYLPEPGTYGTTLTRPDLFKEYYLEQIELLLRHHKVPVVVGVSTRALPLSFALDIAESPINPELLGNLRHIFAMPNIKNIDDHIANGTHYPKEEEVLPLSLFTAERVDFSLQRLAHYTGTSAAYFQKFILLTNYQRYVPPFIAMGKAALSEDSEYVCFVEPGDVVTPNPYRDFCPLNQGESPVSLPQMPAYHLVREDGNGITFINIGIGPSNAKTITDHLAVLRPHCWLMLGHCAGLRDTQMLGDYVLAHGYVREDHVLDTDLPIPVPIPALAEVQIALHEAVERITGLKEEDLKTRMRTGTVLTTDNRNWELRVEELMPGLKQNRAIAVDMESATIAANGFRFRVPYGTLLCVSDRPLHGEIKLKGMAQNFYRERVDQHLLIGIETVKALREKGVDKLHSRKLRGFEDPPFR